MQDIWQIYLNDQFDVQKHNLIKIIPFGLQNNKILTM